MTQGQADIVEAFDETELAERIYVEGCVEALVVAYRLGFKRDSELVVGNLCRVVE